MRSSSTADLNGNSTGAHNPVLLSFGGNSDGTKLHFQRALRRLSVSGFHVTAVSKTLKNPAIGCEPGAADFLNLAVLGEWQGTPEELLDLTQTIEQEEGRPADHPHWHSRTLDIDLILMGTLRMQTERLTIPHPLASQRDFVLIPAQEITPPDLMQFLKSAALA